MSYGPAWYDGKKRKTRRGEDVLGSVFAGLSQGGPRPKTYASLRIQPPDMLYEVEGGSAVPPSWGTG